MIDSRKLKVFLTVARHGSYTAAARSLNTVQSTVSHAIHDLEEDLGCVLFRKAGKRMAATDAAHALLEHAKRIEALMEEARRAVGPDARWGRGKLVIGAGVSASIHLIPEVLRELAECFPECQLSIVSGNAPDVLAAVREGEADLAFTLEPENEPGLEFQPVFSDELAWVLSPLHPWNHAPTARPSDMAGQRLVVFDQGSYTCRLVERFLKARGWTPRSVTHMGSMEAIKAYVKLGQGVGLMPAWVASSELEKGWLKAFPAGRRGELSRHWGVTRRADSPMDDMESTFLQLCSALVANKQLEGWPIDSTKDRFTTLPAPPGPAAPA